MANALDALIDRIPDEALRGQIREALKKQNQQKKFGLVFEDHIPESTVLYDVPVKAGSTVALRGGDVSKQMKVLAIDGEVAHCLSLPEREPVDQPLDSLVSVAKFGEPIYPYLKQLDTVCNAPGSDLWHTLIEADNYHALQLLEYLYAEKIDCIYIDPPYNNRAKTWKYNNDYVDPSDDYRHSKWLSMIEKRLKIAKRLLNPTNSVLIVTIPFSCTLQPFIRKRIDEEIEKEENWKADIQRKLSNPNLKECKRKELQKELEKHEETMQIVSNYKKHYR